MRRKLQILLAGLCLTTMSACEAPDKPPALSAAMAAPPEPHRTPPLPDAVSATVSRLREIAATGSVRDMADLAGETTGFRSNTAGMSNRDYWNLKLRTGDWPMAHAGQVLDYPYAVKHTADGDVFIWPELAVLKGEDITPLDARAIDALVGSGQADSMRAGAPWPGYVLGIAEDGRWLYFVSGAG